jgi:uncharacterized RDD family membrane protein YckC
MSQIYGVATATSKMARSFVTPEGVDLRLELGDGSQRAAAFCIDIAIMATALIAVTLFLVVAGLGTAGLGGVSL